MGADSTAVGDMVLGADGEPTCCPDASFRPFPPVRWNADSCLFRGELELRAVLLRGVAMERCELDSVGHFRLHSGWTRRAGDDLGWDEKARRQFRRAVPAGSARR